jgi:hypothetical protein
MAVILTTSRPGAPYIAWLPNRFTGRGDIGLIRWCDGIARAGRLPTPRLFDWACTRILWTRIIVHLSSSCLCCRIFSSVDSDRMGKKG